MNNKKMFHLLCCVLLAGCQRDSMPGNGLPVPDPSRPITLTVDIVESAVTRGSAPITGDNLLNIGMFAGFEQTDDFSETSQSDGYISNSQYYYRMAEARWEWSQPTYWPMTGRLSFFAYTPYSGSMRLADNTGYPTIQYTPSNDVGSQVDFCMAEPMLDCDDRTHSLPLTFRHCLTAVRLMLNYTGTLPSSDYYVKIDRITLGGLIGTKNVRYTRTEPYFQWDDDVDSLRTASYTLTRKFKSAEYQIWDRELPLRNTDNSNHIQINSENGSKGMLYLLPQQLDGGVRISVAYGFYVQDGDKERPVMQFETEAPLPNPTEPYTGWEPGLCVRYYATLDVGHSRILDLVPEESMTMIEEYVNSTSKPDQMIE